MTTSTPIGTSLSAYRSVTTGMQAAEARAEGDASSIVDVDVQKETLSALAAVFRATDEMTTTAVDLLA